MRVPETKLNISRIKHSRYQSHIAMELEIPILLHSKLPTHTQKRVSRITVVPWPFQHMSIK